MRAPVLVVLLLVGCGGKVSSEPTDAGVDAVIDIGSDTTVPADTAIDVSLPDARVECLSLLAKVDYARYCTKDSPIACTAAQGHDFAAALMACIWRECADRTGFKHCDDDTVVFDSEGCFNGSGSGGGGYGTTEAGIAWNDCVSATFEGPLWLCAAGKVVRFTGCVGK